MGKLKLEYLSLQDAAKTIAVEEYELWQLIETGQIDASIRQGLVDAMIHQEVWLDVLSTTTFLLPRKFASEISARGKSLIDYVEISLKEPKQEEFFDDQGDYVSWPVYRDKVNLVKEFEINKSDIVITIDSIEKYIKNNEVNFNKPLAERERETLLIIIAALAKENKLDIQKISKTAELIANMTERIGAPISATTIERHLKNINPALSNRTK